MPKLITKIAKVYCARLLLAHSSDYHTHFTSVLVGEVVSHPLATGDNCKPRVQLRHWDAELLAAR